MKRGLLALGIAATLALTTSCNKTFDASMPGYEAKSQALLERIEEAYPNAEVTKEGLTYYVRQGDNSIRMMFGSSRYILPIEPTNLVTPISDGVYTKVGINDLEGELRIKIGGETHSHTEKRLAKLVRKGKQYVGL